MTTIAGTVRTVRREAETIRSYEIIAENGEPLPRFAAGAHVDLHLPNGLVRSYSLVNHPGERHRYVVAVHRDQAGRGGSQYVHDSLTEGSQVTLSLPRNHFPLDENASHTVLIAGGVGITPFMSMMERLVELGRPFEAHFAARTTGHAPFLTRIEGFRASGADIRLYLGNEGTSGRLNIADIVGRAAPSSHLYCCGPTSMLSDFLQATASRPEECVHVERFQNALEPNEAGGFEIELRRSGITLEVVPGQSILEAVLSAGVDVAFSCEEGVCGTCEVMVLEGAPLHRDQYLTPSERAANRSIMICCSGAISSKLVLDL